MRIYVCLRVHLCVCQCIWVCTNVCMCVYQCVYVCVFLLGAIFIYIQLSLGDISYLWSLSNCSVQFTSMFLPKIDGRIIFHETNHVIWKHLLRNHFHLELRFSTCHSLSETNTELSFYICRNNHIFCLIFIKNDQNGRKNERVNELTGYETTRNKMSLVHGFAMKVSFIK